MSGPTTKEEMEDFVGRVGCEGGLVDYVLARGPDSVPWELKLQAIAFERAYQWMLEEFDLLAESLGVEAY